MTDFYAALRFLLRDLRARRQCHSAELPSADRSSGPSLPAPEQPVGDLPGLPGVYFRTLNDYAFWPLPGQEADAAGIQRIFAVRPPLGAPRRCAVEVTPGVSALIRSSTQFELPRQHALWDLVCRTALSRHLLEQDRLPRGVLPVSDLSPHQLEAVRSMLGLAPLQFRGGRDSAGVRRKAGAPH